MTVPPTATLAELYVKQGLVGRARAIYRALVEAGGAQGEAAQKRLLELPPGAEGSIEVLQRLLQRVQQNRAAPRERGCPA
jgi:hypothetical protein